ncbi:family 16 glycosylhydrolase [Streptococcus thoraltensis]|uniref:family 16 glycosylhydrolase n=1 Tax=Streptococcus thoraltensis TaxID=55085 RepID=UPI001F594739|nr:family 16 glycosylhydrolase [Streptococcus thoraltensis]
MKEQLNSQNIFSIRKYTIGVCSVAIGIFFLCSGTIASAEAYSSKSEVTTVREVHENMLSAETSQSENAAKEEVLDANEFSVSDGDFVQNAAIQDLHLLSNPSVGEAHENMRSAETSPSENAAKEEVLDANEYSVSDSDFVQNAEIQDLNLVNNPSFESGDFVSNKPTSVIYRDKDYKDYKTNENGNTIYKTKINSTNDFILFEVNTIPGKTYRAIADLKIDVLGNSKANGAFFDIKSISADGTQKTLEGGKGVNQMQDSLGDWSLQEITFTAESYKTHIGLVKWHENSNDLETINTTIKMNSLKIFEDTKYDEIWKDTFSESKLNDNIWGYELGNIRGNEQQHYSSSAENVTVKDGKLVLTVTDRPIEDQYYNKDKHGDRARLVKYNSGSIRTSGKQEFLYGRIEARMKLPKGKGVFPAFWTLGADFNLDGRIESGQGYNWPSTGEIDIMELTGTENGSGNKTVYGTPHFFFPGADADNDGNVGSGYSGNLSLNEDFSEDYHIFGINWSEDRIEWYVDDVIYNTLVYDKSERSQALKKAFNRPQFIQFNLATGGNWPGDAGNNLAGQTVEVDWVRWLQNEEQKQSMLNYYADKPIISGVRNITVIQGTIPDLLEGISINNSDYKVDYSIDNEYMFINQGAEAGRNEVTNVVENSSKAEKIAQLEPGVYNIYYTSIPLKSDYDSKGFPIYKMTRESSQLIVLPHQLEARVGQELSTIKLPSGWRWQNPTEIIDKNTDYGIVFVNPNDTIKLSNRREVYTQINSDSFLSVD